MVGIEDASVVSIVSNFTSIGFGKTIAESQAYLTSLKQISKQTEKNVVVDEAAIRALLGLSNKKLKEASITQTLTVLKNKEGAATGLLVSEVNKLSASTTGYNSIAQKTIITNEAEIKTILAKTTFTKEHQAAILTSVGASNVAIAKQSKVFGVATKKVDAFYKKMNKLRWAMVNFVFVAAAAAIVIAPFVLLAKHGADLEESFAKVAKTTGLTAEGIKDLRKELVDMSRTLPLSIKELSDVAAVAGQLGIAKENIGKFTQAVAIISTVTGDTAEETAKSFAKLAAAFQLPIDSVLRLGNVLNDLGNNTAATASDIVTSLLRVGASAETLGISFDQASAASATLINAGFAATRTGTALSRLFIMLSAHADKFAKITGETIADYKKGLAEDPNKQFRKVVSSLHDMIVAGYGAEASILVLNAAGLRSGPALLSMATNMETFNKTTEDAANNISSIGSILENYNKLMDTSRKEGKKFFNEMVGDLDSTSSGFNKVYKSAIRFYRLFGRYYIDLRQGPKDLRAYKTGMEDLAKALDDGTLSAKAYQDIMDIVTSNLLKGDLPQAIANMQLALANMGKFEAPKKPLNIPFLEDFKHFDTAYKRYAEAMDAIKNYSGNDPKAIAELLTNLEDVKTVISEGLINPNALKGIEEMYSRVNKLSDSVNKLTDSFSKFFNLALKIDRKSVV